MGNPDILRIESLDMTMINVLLSLPTILGLLVFVGLIAIIGLAAYLLSYKLISRYPPEEIHEIRDATSGLFRVVGILVSLFLSLTFAEVVVELNAIEIAIEGEAVAIADIHQDLRRFGVEETRDIRALVIDYTQAVIDDDWPALADGRLGNRADALLVQLGDAVLRLEPNNRLQERLIPRIIADKDKIDDLRLSRLQQVQAISRPPFFLIVVFFGFLVTMVCFGVYRPRGFIILVSLYTFLIGLTIYLILDYGDPLHGLQVPGVDTVAFEYVLEKMQAGR